MTLTIRSPLAMVALTLWSQEIAQAAPVTLQLKWFHQAQFAGYYAAQEKGFYKDAGLEVTLKEGGPDVAPDVEVGAGRAQFGVLASELLVRYAEGAPLVLVTPIFQHSARALIVPADSDIHTPHDLVGKRINANLNEFAEIEAMLRLEGVDFQRIHIAPTVPDNDRLLAAGAIEGFMGSLANQPFALLQKGVRTRLLRPSAYGIDFYGDCLFTSQEYAATHGSKVEAFRKATLRGWDHAVKHPAETVDLIRERYHSQKSREALLFEIEQISRLLESRVVEIGHNNPSRWEAIAAIYASQNVISNIPDLDAFFWNPFSSEAWRLRVILWSVSAVAALAGLSAAFLWIFNRRLDARVRERTARLEEASLVKTEFLACMSHELRTPLNTIVGLADLMVATNHDPAQAEHLTTLHRAAEILLALINDVLDFSEIETNRVRIRPDTITLRDLIDEVTGLMSTAARKKGLAVHSSIAGSVPHHVEADPMRLRQVLVNLLSNAVKFTEYGQISLDVATLDGRILFSVRDTGVGIAPSLRSRIFDAFSQGDASLSRRYGGTGLGLSIAKRLVELMQGEISYESEVGRGTCFTFSLPLRTPSAFPSGDCLGSGAH